MPFLQLLTNCGIRITIDLPPDIPGKALERMHNTFAPIQISFKGKPEHLEESNERQEKMKIPYTPEGVRVTVSQ